MTTGQERSNGDPPSRGRARIERVAVFLGVWLPLVAVAHQMALGWDEGYTFDRILGTADRGGLLPWLRQFPKRPVSHWPDLFTRPVLEHHWRFSKEEPDGHGPFYALLSLAGYATVGRWLEPPASFRIGSVTLFAFAATCVYQTMRRRFGMAVGLLTTALVASVPRLVPEVSFALIDGPLVSLALLAWCSFVAAAESRKAAVAYGVWIGAALATKLTGWFLPIPYLIWTAVRAWRRRLPAPESPPCTPPGPAPQDHALGTLAIGAATALIVLVAINVGWWPDPINGVRRFLVSNLTRSESIPIGIQFLGTRYAYSLPWYNTAAWTVVAMPAGTLLLGSIGLVATCRRRDPFGFLVVGNWLLILVVRALPQAPGHDGTRQLAVSFAFLAVLAGYGLACLCGRAAQGCDVGVMTLLARGARRAWLLGARSRTGVKGREAASTGGTERPGEWRWAAALLLGLAAAAESIGAAVRYHPLQLSYYGPLVGGLPGAARLGFEPTYFWDALTPEVLEWLGQHTDPDRYVLFRNNPTSWNYLAAWGRLRVRYQGPQLLQRAQWVVMQHRPGIFLPADDWLIDHGTPAFRKTLFGVPLISIYPFEQFLDAQRVRPAPPASATGDAQPATKGRAFSRVTPSAFWSASGALIKQTVNPSPGQCWCRVPR